MKKVFCATGLMLSACVAAPVGLSNSSPLASDWSLVWSDEFDGATIDTSIWRYDLDCWGGGNNEKQCYTDSPKNAFLQEGLLHIVARQEQASGAAFPDHMQSVDSEGRQTKTQPFTSARLKTKGKADWRYGRIEVRAKLPTGQGAWPAIWMMPADNVYGTWAASGEIDIMETVNLGATCETCEGGIENRVLGTLHYGGKFPNNVNSGADTSLPKSGDGFNTFAVEWTEGQIRWFIDDVPFATQTSEDWYSDEAPRAKVHAPFDERFYLILNFAVGGNWPEGQNDGGINLEDFPKSLQIDWVRVYECQGDETGTACT